METIKEKATMSVCEMRNLLGIKKTDSYWLIKKQYFKTVNIAGRMRVDIQSFEDWYANQLHYHKVTGEEPGQKIRETSYSIRDISEMLGITETSVLDMIHREDLPVDDSHHHWRVDKDVFDHWYQNQNHYRTVEDRERDRGLEEISMSLPEMGALLCLDRNGAYQIVRENPEIQVIQIAGRKRVIKESFERWYSMQDHYQKFDDLAPADRKQFLQDHANNSTGRKLQSRISKQTIKERLKEKRVFSVDETARMLEISRTAVLRLIQNGGLKALRYGKESKITSDSILWLVLRETHKTSGGI